MKKIKRCSIPLLVLVFAVGLVLRWFRGLVAEWRATVATSSFIAGL